MNFYQQEFLRIRKAYFHDQEIINRLINARRKMMHQGFYAFSLDQLANGSCLSKYHFLRLFKRYYGRTPGKMLAEARAQKARLLLKAGHSVYRTATELGFESSTSFCKFFRKHTGMPPVAIRKTAILDRFARGK